MRRILFLVCLLGVLAATGAAASIGITAEGGSPNDLGTIQPGTSRTITWYITTTGIDEPFTISPKAADALWSRIFSRGGVNEALLSQEPVRNWVTFEQRSFRIDPSTNGTVPGSDGRSYHGTMTFTVRVPVTAEPGIHAGSIRLNPDFSETGGGYGASTRGLTRPTFHFRVPGDPRRSVIIDGVQTFRTDERVVRIDTILRNTGTVTTSIVGGELVIRDPRGTVVGTVPIGSHTLGPGGQKRVVKQWTGGDIEAGTYQLNSEFNYVTGNAVWSQAFSIPDVIEVVPDNVTTGGTGPADREPFPLPLVLMVLALLGVLMYSFEVDPFWIVAIIGFLGLSAFIIGSGIPDYTIAILLIVAGGAYYIS